MIEIHAVYLVIAAFGIFIVGMLWGKALCWGVLLYPRYWLWRATGGVRKLLDATGKASLSELFDIPEHALGIHTESGYFWTHLSERAEGENFDGYVAVPNIIPLGHCFGRELFCAVLDLPDVKAATMMQVNTHYLYVCEGRLVELRCHRRHSLAFAAFCVYECSMEDEPVCRMRFDAMERCSPRVMQRDAERNGSALMQRLEERSGAVEEKLFAIEGRGSSGPSVYCMVEKNVARLDLFFGTQRALDLFSLMNEVHLRPMTLEVMVPRKAVTSAR